MKRTLRPCLDCPYSGVHFLYGPDGGTLARVTCRHRVWKSGGYNLLACIPPNTSLDAIAVHFCPLVEVDTPAAILAEVQGNAELWAETQLTPVTERQGPPPLPPRDDDERDAADDWKR